MTTFRKLLLLASVLLVAAFLLVRPATRAQAVTRLYLPVAIGGAGMPSTPTATHTLSPTASLVPTSTATSTTTPSPTATATLKPTGTATATLKPTSTNTPQPTVAATATPTKTPKPTATVKPTKTPRPTATATRVGNCHPSYPTVCIPPPPPDLNCTDIPHRNFTVLPPDPHNFDGNHDGVGCEEE